MDIKEKQCIKGFQVTPMNLMHISLDLSVQKVFKNTRKGVACTGACLRSQVNQAQIRRYQSRNNSRPEIPKVVVLDAVHARPCSGEHLYRPNGATAGFSERQT